MLVSQSPPVFSHSPPTGFLAQNYASFRSSFRDISSTPKLHRATSFHQKNPLKMPTVPRRPILVIRTNEETPSSDDDLSSPTKTKKKVVFADDKGMSLTQVRMMTEPSNVPPLWSKRFLAEVTQGISADPEVSSNSDWEITFPQPASDYVKFRQKLDVQKVSLENILVKENENQIMGTIKVANLSFEKHVYVRSSCDDWTTQQDTTCSFVPNSLPSSAYVIHDTFKFNLNLPAKSKRLEFCICYKSNGTDEYWDNNENKNFLLLKKIHLNRSSSNDSFLRKNGFDVNIKTTHATFTKIDSWSEFASWTHLENSAPYW